MPLFVLGCTEFWEHLDVSMIRQQCLPIWKYLRGKLTKLSLREENNCLGFLGAVGQVLSII